MLFEGLSCSNCTNSQKVYRGCTTPAYDSFVYGSKEFHYCPVKEITEESYFMIRMYSHYTKGFLLYSGGIVDQPLRYLEAMEVIHTQVDECNKAKADSQERHDAAINQLKKIGN